MYIVYMNKIKYVPTVNKIYNNYKVISNNTRITGSGLNYEVECLCGKREFKPARHLESGRTKMCKSCSSKLTFKNYPQKGFQESWKGSGFGLISKTWFSSIKDGAKKRNIEFNITIDEAWSLAEKQNFKCALTGDKLVFSKEIKNSNPNWNVITASLDRIDSNKPYDIDNIQWVHKTFNRFKNNYEQNEFIDMCEKVVNYQINKTILSQDIS